MRTRTLFTTAFLPPDHPPGEIYPNMEILDSRDFDKDEQYRPHKITSPGQRSWEGCLETWLLIILAVMFCWLAYQLVSQPQIIQAILDFLERP